MQRNDAAIAAIEFAIDPNTECPIEFLRLWLEGNFDAIEKEWPEAPEAVYRGVDLDYPRRHKGTENENRDD